MSKPCGPECECCERIRGVLRKKRDWHEDQASVYARILIDAGLIEAPSTVETGETEEDDDAEFPPPVKAAKAKPSSNGHVKGLAGEVLEKLKSLLADGPKTVGALVEGCNSNHPMVGKLLKGNSSFKKVDPANRLSEWQLA